MKILRILKSIGKGILKSLPFIDVFNEIKELRRAEKVDVVRRLAEADQNPESKKAIYKILDLLDDGKINDSFDQKLLDSVIQILTSGAVLISAIIYIINNL